MVNERSCALTSWIKPPFVGTGVHYQSLSKHVVEGCGGGGGGCNVGGDGGGGDGGGGGGGSGFGCE